MKVLEINTEKTWRGGEKQTLLSIFAFLLYGLDISLLCLKDSPLSIKIKKFLPSLEIIEVSNNFHAWRYLVDSGRKYDIIHAQTAKSQGLAVFSKKFHKKPVVYTRRVDFVPKGIITCFKYRCTDKVIAISNAIADVLKSIGLKNIDVISSCIFPQELRENGYNTYDDNITFFLKDLKKNNTLIFSTIAALVPHKDPFTMVEAINFLRKTCNKKFMFLHFGSGPLKDKVISLIKHYKLERYYKLMGFVDDVEKYFPLFDLFVMSSKEEGLGSSVLEAFRYKIPVVSTTAGGLNELLREERGLLSPVGEPQNLAFNIQKIINDNYLKNKLINNAYQYVIKYHSLDNMALRYIEIFRSLVHK
ncbi:glycosyltransferase family 4 protein [Desulfonauticus submarinus]